MKLKGNAIFELFLIALSAGMFIVSFTYNPRARFAPELLSVLMFFLAMLLFLGENIPYFQKRMKFMNQRGFFTKTESEGENRARVKEQSSSGELAQSEPGTASGSGSGAAFKENLKLIRLLLWLILFAVMLRYVSYLITVPVWLLLFIKLESERSWLQSGLVAVGMGIFDYVLFAVLLRATF